MHNDKKIMLFNGIMDLIGNHVGDWNDVTMPPEAPTPILMIAETQGYCYYHTGYYQPKTGTFHCDEEIEIKTVRKWRYDDADKVYKALIK